MASPIRRLNCLDTKASLFVINDMAPMKQIPLPKKGMPKEEVLSPLRLPLKE